MTTSPEIIIQPRKGWIPIDWRELWEHRELLGFLIQRDLKVRYKQTVLGAAWAILQPVFSVAIFSVHFGAFAKIPSDGVPYPVFAFAGMLPWLLFSTAVSTGGLSLVNQQHLLTKVSLPRMFIPASAIGTSVADFALAFLFLIVLMDVNGLWPTLAILAVLPITLLIAVAALGVSLCLAALTVSYRDVRFVLPFMRQIWMYLSPVIYPVSMVPE
ncbi:MAG: ABC transporter permease, partial [bacterium]